MRARGLVIVSGLFVALAAIAGLRYQNRTVPLTEVYTPTIPVVEFAPPGESLRALDARLKEDANLSIIRQVLPDQAGVLWIALLVFLVLGFDYARPWSARNVDLLIVQVIGWCLIGSLDLLVTVTRRNDPTYYGLLRLIFTIVTALSAVLMARMVWRSTRSDNWTWTSAIDVRTLAALAAFTVTLSLAYPFLRPAEDASYFTNLGGQRLRERGLLPYGDPMLTDTPGAGYGPLMYAAQASMQIILREAKNDPSPDLPQLGEQSTYMAPSPTSSQFLLAGFQLLAAWALFRIGQRCGSDALGLALAALYCASTGVLGVGGSGDQISGMTFVSHIVPASVTLVAFRYLDRPALAGALLAAAAAFGFYPAFMFPTWLGYYWGDSRKAAWQYVIGFGMVCLAVGGWVLFASRPADGMGLVATIVRDTLGHQTNPEVYGRTPFGFWGQQTGVWRWLIQPMTGESAMLSPFFLLYCSFLVATMVMARNAGVVGLALLTGAVALGANIWKINATGAYLAWYYPFLLIGTLGPGILMRRQLNSRRTASDQVIAAAVR
ncbi:MAG TPA: hypothetical protein VFZ31_03585 [Vicinamibacterales bacterium]